MILDRLQDKTKQGVQVKRLIPADNFEAKSAALGPHRDDHYVFLLARKGEGRLTVDLNDITLTAGDLFYVAPGQVHTHIRTRDAEGWFLAVESYLVPLECRHIFEGRLQPQRPQRLKNKDCDQLLALIERRSEDTTTTALHALTKAFLLIAAEAYDDTQESGKATSRAVALSRQFKLLMTDNIQTLKTPAGYAKRLHITPAYLNEVIRGVTGLPVSHWIQQEILTEAKRLLYHSDLSVKEVAATLGYTDAGYFSRFFKNAAGMSALAFRAAHRR